jgi:hypothetical protein
MKLSIVAWLGVVVIVGAAAGQPAPARAPRNTAELDQMFQQI